MGRLTPRYAQLSDEKIARKVKATHTSQDFARRSLATMVECDPLSEIKPDRKCIHIPEEVPPVEPKKRLVDGRALPLP